MLEVGKLYSCEEYYILIYPDKAAAMMLRSTVPFSTAAASSSYCEHWSNRLGKPVNYAARGVCFLVLNVEESYYEILAGDCKGWVNNMDWLRLKNVRNDYETIS